MFPSIAKFCTLGALLISATAPHASAEILDWTLALTNLDSDFSIDSTNEITLEYEIGTGRSSYEVNIFTKGCIDPITDIDVLFNSEVEGEVVEGLQKLNVFLDVDKSALFGSQIWTDATRSLELCVRVDLKSAKNGVIKRLERNIKLDFDFRVDFTAINDVNFTKLTVGDGVDGWVGVLNLVFVTTIAVSGVNMTGVDENTAGTMMEVFQAGLNKFLAEGSTNEVYSFGDFGDMSSFVRKLQTDNETKVLSEVTISQYCNGTNDCGSEAFGSFETFKTELLTSIGDGSFTESIQEIAIEGGVTELDSAVATSVEISTPEVEQIGYSSTTARVENYIEACTCDGATNFVCNTNLLGKDDFLNVCIKSTSTDVEIDDLENITMTQDGNEFVIVQGGALQDATISSKTKVALQNGMHIATVIPADFFSYDSTTTAQVAGVVYLKLANSRRRLAVEINGQSKAEATGSIRALATPFGDIDAGFAINVVLEKIELDGAAIEANDAKASTNVMMIGIIVAFAAAAVAIMVFFFVKKSGGQHKNSWIAKSVAI